MVSRISLIARGWFGINAEFKFDTPLLCSYEFTAIRAQSSRYVTGRRSLKNARFFVVVSADDCCDILWLWSFGELDISDDIDVGYGLAWLKHDF